jgi:hypothetical protein
VTIERSTVSDSQTGGVEVIQSGGATISVWLSYDFIDDISTAGTYTINSTRTNTILSDPGVTLTPMALQ